MNLLNADHGFELATIPLTMVPLASAAQYFFGILLSITSVFLILLILIQRGRGGGLAGAFGGMGGQSAFGTKAGDTFTRITIVVSVIWILICVTSVMFLSTSKGPLGKATPIGETNIDVTPAERSATESGAGAGAGAGAGTAAPADTNATGGADAADTGAAGAGAAGAGATDAATGNATTDAPAASGAAEVTPPTTETPAESTPATGTNP